MCLLTIVTGPARRFPIIILNNRDEQVTRATSQLKLFGAAGTPLTPRTSGPSSSPSTTPAPSVVPPSRANLLCAIDTSIPNGGTWMGVNVATGAFASLTNSPQCASQVMHLPTYAPSRVGLTAMSSKFDIIEYLSKVLIGEGAAASSSTTTASGGVEGTGAATTSVDGDSSQCCGLKPASPPGVAFPRPFLAFSPARSRGCVVGEYLSESSWGADGTWNGFLPTNVVDPAAAAAKVGPSTNTVAQQDLFYEGYNLICGNLVGIADGLKARWDGIASASASSTAAAASPAAPTESFLYTTNRMQPYPFSNRSDADPSTVHPKAEIYSGTWDGVAASAPPTAPFDKSILEAQPAIRLGAGGAANTGTGASPSPSLLTVDTVSNTFLNNPLEPKSLHLTASVRRTLEALFPSPRNTPAEEREREAVDVAETLIPALAACLCERPEYKIDVSEPNGRHRPLLTIRPMAGLTPVEYKAALAAAIGDKMKAMTGKMEEQQQQQQKTGAHSNGSSSPASPSSSAAAAVLAKYKADPQGAIDAIAADVMGYGDAMRSFSEARQAEVHANVYTHLTPDAATGGVFKTRTQTIAVLEDLTADSNATGAGTAVPRYRLHYYLRDTESADTHGDWQVQVVDLPVA